MANEWKAPLKWSNEGVEPSENLKANGFQAGYKPPAPVFNYFLHREQECIEQLQEAVDNAESAIAALEGQGGGGLPIVTASSSNGEAYTGTVEDITELSVGVTVVFIPTIVSASTTPTLNINNLGAKGIRRRLSNLGSTVQAGYANTWLAANKAHLLVYDGSYWIVDGYTKPAAADLYGTVSIEKGGTGANTAEKARANLGVAPTIQYGTNEVIDGAASSYPEGTLYVVIE